MKKVYIRFTSFFLVLLFSFLVLTGCSEAKETGELNSDPEMIDQLQELSQQKKYTNFETEAYYETMLAEGELELKGTVYRSTSPLRMLTDMPENIENTVTKMIFGVEREYKLATVFENEALDLKICQYVSSQGQIIKINATTGSLMGYSDTKSTIGKPGKRRASDEELIEKATEYLDEFIDEDITPYSAELTRETDYSNYVCFALKKNGKTVYRAYHIYLDYSGEFWNYLANDSIEYKEIKELSEDAFKQAEAAAETAMMDVCENNGISFSEISKRNASMYYSAEDSCPIINFAYTVPVSVDGETKEQTIVVQVKAK